MNIVTQINSEWRLALLQPAPGRRTAAWSLEQMTNGQWQSTALVRSKDMLLWSLPRCGSIDPLALAIIEALPPRADIDLTRTPEQRREAVNARRQKHRS